MDNKIYYFVAIVILILVIVWYNKNSNNSMADKAYQMVRNGTIDPMQLTKDCKGNPASCLCPAVGGKSHTLKDTLGEYGECVFPDGSKINEWKLFRGD